MRAIDRRRGVDCDADRCGIYNLAGAAALLVPQGRRVCGRR